MYQNTCTAAGVCAEQDISDPLISQETESLPLELDYSGFDIVKVRELKKCFMTKTMKKNVLIYRRHSTEQFREFVSL